MKHFRSLSIRVGFRLVVLIVSVLLSVGALAFLFHAAAATPAQQTILKPESNLQIRFASPDTRHTQSVAWGDIDGDGDLDLAVGNGVYQEALSWLNIADYNQIDQVYINNGRGVFTAQDIAAEPAGGADTRGVAWGDVDGDGDLDLAVANGGAWSGAQGNIVYENVGGVLSYSAEEGGAGWASTESRMSSSVGWGDWDGDGDLDLAYGNEGTPNQVYENISGTLQFDPVAGIGWESPQEAQTSSLAWGDWDGDGDLDLAFGNYGGGDALQVYENISGTLQLDPDLQIGWTSGSSALVQAIAWGDWDDDGDLDLAAGGGSRGNERVSFLQIWENEDGSLALDPVAGLGWERDTTLGQTALSKPAGLAWFDWDRDGDLDLATANNAGGGWGRANQVYENAGGVMALDPNNDLGWQSPLRATLNSETTFAVAAGDADGDGDLDLAFGNGGIENGGQTNLIFGNLAPIVGFATKPWESADARAGTGVAWGDWDGDGDLDMAVANDGEPVIVYENVEGVLGWEPAAGIGWEAPISNTARSMDVAWGDWDGDGDLDLAVANDGAPDMVYEYENGNLALNPALGLGWQTSVSDTSQTRTAAWGDLDSDGDLDLVLGKANDFTQIYENEAGTLQLDPSQGWGWVSPQKLTVEDAAWGDWDDDGDLDLALGARVYENEGDDLLFDPANGVGWDGHVSATSVAWGDVDGDGDLDLAVGSQTRARVFENMGGRLDFDPRAGKGWESFEIMQVRGIAWGDADGDGDLDLATASDANWGFEPDRVFENVNGDLSTVSVWETADGRLGNGILQQSQDVAWGDVDNDGDLDLAFANYCTGNNCDSPGRPNQVYLNTLQRAAANLPIRAVPLLSVSDPDATSPANFYASPDIVSSNVISVPYQLADLSATPVGRIEMFYSLDGGDNWQPARPTADTQTTNLATSAAGTQHVFGWDTFGSDFFGRSDNVAIRLVVYQTPRTRDVTDQGTYRYFNSASGSFQRPSTTATTFPFRVQSTQIRVVDGQGSPVKGAWVYRLPAGQIDGALLMPDPAHPQTTDDEGLLPGGGALQPGDQLVALIPAPGNPVTFSNKVRLFYTSAPPTEGGLGMDHFDQPGIVELVVSRDNPLLLFDLDVALEWDARNDATFLTELSNSFERASEILYDVTNGQAALGVVRVFQDKEYWPQADVVILGNNSMRPSAAIGGIAKSPISETVRVGLDETKIISNAYNGGQIRMGTVWDPFGENTAELGEEWWRALAHELSHYLLFLPDNYLGFKEGGVLGRINCQGSFMTSTYDPTYSEFLTEKDWLGACRDSLAERTTGRTDWDTIRNFYPMLGETGSVDPTLQGPTVQPLSLTDVIFWPQQETRTPLRARNFDVRDETNERLRLPAAQAYLFQEQGTEDPTDDMIVLLGTPTGGGDRLKVRGAFPGDRLCLIESSPGQAFIGCDDDLQAADVSIRAQAMNPGWQPQIDVQAVTSRTFQITVTQPLSPSEFLNVQVFPQHYWSLPNFSGLSPTTTLQTSGDSHTGTLTMTLPAYEVAVRAWVEGDDLREAVSQFVLNPPWPTAGPNSTGIGGPNSTGIGGPNSTGIGGPNSTGIGGPNSTGIGGPNSTGIGGPNSTGIGGPNSTGIGGPNSTGIGGPNSTGIGGPNSTGIGGPNSTGIGGPNSTGIGGPNSTGIGGASFHAPIRSADAQVVIYSRLGFFEDNGVKTIQHLGRVPALSGQPWLIPVGQAYQVELDPQVIDSRVIALNYLQRDVPEGYEQTLTIYFLPEDAQAWRPLVTSRYTENLVVADLQEMNGTYAVMSTIEMPTLKPGWNLFVYPLPVTRTVTETMASLAVPYAVVEVGEDPTTLPKGDAVTNVSEFRFGNAYWIRIDGDRPVTPYLAPPRRLPDGSLE